jgi:hypothetical protein
VLGAVAADQISRREISLAALAIKPFVLPLIDVSLAGQFMEELLAGVMVF